MTIQTDLKDIEKGCRNCTATYSLDKIGKYCTVCYTKRQTFIDENLKRLNEESDFLNKIYPTLHLSPMSTRDEVKIRISKLKSEKGFLEGKK